MTSLRARMDAEVAEVFPHLPAVDLTNIPAARETMRDLLAAATQDIAPNPKIRRSDHTAPGLDGAPDVRLRQYRPLDAPEGLPCLYWIHGGGHVLGEMAQDDLLMEHFVEAVGCAAMSVEWRHSPEHPFPASMNDCYAGLVWTYENAGQLGIDPLRMAVGGASSGGGSAAGLALMARDRDRIPLCFQLLVYPMLDDRNTTNYPVTDPRLWNKEANVIAWQSYLGGTFGTDSVSPYAAPARAGDLAGLPPAFIAVGDIDGFVNEDITYAHRLVEAGVVTELHVYAGGIHGFDVFAPESALTKRFQRDRDGALCRAFGVPDGR